MATRTRLAPVTGVLATLLLTALAGCGPQDADPAGTDEPSAAAESTGPADEPEETTSEAASEPAEPSEPAEEPHEPGSGTVTEALLPAADLPGFNDEFTWAEGATGSSEPRELAGACHQFEMASIGAEEVAYRSYDPATGGDATAGELVAEFPDEMTATRALEVLKSWRKGCARGFRGYDRVRVDDLTDVDTGSGTGHWYLLTYGPAEGEPDAGYFDAQGIARVGRRIAVLRLTTVGQDYNYEPGQEPMVEAVRAAAARL